MLHQVGVGALGPVFRTYEPTRDRLVAVKVFRLDITPEQAQALADALSAAAEAGLFHPSIVEPIAAGLEGAVAYRAEEYVAAESLDVAMRHYAPARLGTVLPFIAQLAGAIDFARSAGIGHGALHPRDIFVTTDEARATGFGIVEALERVGLRAPVRRPYAAPERVAGHAWSTPADVFALAVIAYELLTGRRPAGMGGEIGPLSGIREPELSALLHAVLARAMDEDPSRRYPTALAFASALETASTGGRAELPAAAPPLDEDAVRDELPPQAALDERHDPAAAEQQEDAFRADEPEFDDIAAERDEDQAHADVLRTERAAEADRDFGDPVLFDDEAVDDLALEEPERSDERERFADEFGAGSTTPEERTEQHWASERVSATPSQTAAEAAAAPAYGSSDEPFAARHAYNDADERRPRPAMLPIAIAAVLGLLVGFAAGYAVARRTPALLTATAADVPAASEAAPTGTTPGAGKPFSEQTVLPTDAPAVPAEAPAAPAESPAAAAAAPPVPPASEPAATAGRLVVRSTPAKAGVTVDGEWRGRTPLTLEGVPFGRHEVRIVQDGYRVARREVTLSPAAPSGSVSVRLEPTPATRTPGSRTAAAPRAFTGSIYVDSRPRGARVYVDGTMVGVTPLRLPEVPIGSRVVRLELPDHRVWSTAARVVAGRESRVTGSLERIR